MSSSSLQASDSERARGRPRKTSDVHTHFEIDTKFAHPDLRPTDPLVRAMLTDMYQLTMCYAYWKSGKRNDHSVFDLFFRKNPFGGEFTIFAGLEECIRFVANFSFSDSDVAFLKDKFPPGTDPAFFEYMRQINTHDVRVYGIPEGTVVFPRMPLIRVEGPLPICQLLETTLLTLVNFASLVATNAARFRLAAGPEVRLLEFGLRRAQGPDGGITASRYCFIGGFDATSNVSAGKMFNIPISGTHAHSFVSSFQSFDEIKNRKLVSADDASRTCDDFVEEVLRFQTELKAKVDSSLNTNQSELAAFACYAICFPTSFLALVDTYDVVRSGIPNFMIVALALNAWGYRAMGIRLDSGDLAYQSKQARAFFVKCSEAFELPFLQTLNVVASNNIDEETIMSLNAQKHQIDTYGVGTHLVTCKSQPALGCVYKLVEINKEPRIKLSADIEKVTIPGRKDVYRLYGSDGCPLIDLLMLSDEPAPEPGERILCRHPFVESKRANVRPSRVERLLNVVWEENKLCTELPALDRIKEHAKNSMSQMRPDHLRTLNPTPYKVSVSDKLYHFIHSIWLDSAPIGELE